MSGFFNELKQSFSSPKQAPQQLDETSKAILDIENKKRAITQASNSDQNAIKTKINDEYRKIGETSYALYAGGNFEVEKITSMFQTVKGFYQTLDEKQTKLNEILGRYDEELKILRPAPPTGQETCPGCRALYAPGEMLFCSTCGGKLPEKVAEIVTSRPTQKSSCPSCGAAYIPGEMLFCSGCGNKLDAVESTPVTQPTCPSCKAILVPDAAFCNSCGTKVSVGAGSMPMGAVGAVGGVMAAATLVGEDGLLKKASGTVDDVRNVVDGISSVASMFGFGDSDDYESDDE